MHERFCKILFALILLPIMVRAGDAAPPRVTNERYKLELVASEPDIVTPIGLAFDRQGRLFVVESHTHERPDDYQGPDADRIRILADSNGDGRPDRWSTFGDGFRHAMNLLAREDGAIYLVERGRVLLLRDTNKGGVADAQDELLRLETADDYPHNALGGIAQDSDGSLVVGLGENHGMAYRLIGADGTVIADDGGQDGFYRITSDGKKLQRIARGVWNPFAVCIAPDRTIFAVDNDPDSSPPCRLLHVIPGGDYGYLYQYGRAGTHPLQAWNGELPGTLPMVCGVGEAPTAIVAHQGSLWVTSWGDHRIERYRLVPRATTYSATREVVVQGDADFRPTGMAVAPDGSLYFGDWVLRDYPVHGKGRIWRLVLPDDAQSHFPLVSGEQLATAPNGDSRLAKLVANRWCGADDVESLLHHSLEDESADMRLYAVRWIADERITALRDEVAKLLEGPQPSPRYYLAVLAAVDWLDHEPSMRGRDIADELLVRELRNNRRSPQAHALALRLLSPDSKFLTLDRLRDYLQSKQLALEAVRSLAQQSNAGRFQLLAEVACDEKQDVEVRAEAIVGLAAVAEPHRDLLERLANISQPMLQSEAQRVLRVAGLRPMAEEAKPSADNLVQWNALLKEAGNPDAGRRLFFSPVGARCGVCHQHDGRGGRVGPDLTHIGRSTSRERIVAAILQPSQEIAPHFQPWQLTTKDGKTHVALRLHEPGDDGNDEYFDSNGQRFSLPSDAIESREAAATSIMPGGLETIVSIADLRDLVSFLTLPPE